MKAKKVYVNQYELSELDTSSKDEKFRLTSPDAEVKINRTTKKLIEFASDKQGMDARELVKLFSAREGTSSESTGNTVSTLFEKDIFLENPENLRSSKALNNEELSYRSEMDQLWFRKKLFDPDKLSHIFKKFEFTFSGPFVAVTLTSFILMEVYFFYSAFFSNWSRNLTYFSPYDYLLFFPLSSLLTLIHETGHTVATKSHDLSMPKGMGIGVYYFIVIYYADTHESWSISRKKRAVIAVAGIYWETFALTVLIPLCLLLNSAALRDFILLTHISFLWVFNPFLKMDGYWLITDLLGVTNLHGKVQTYFSNLIGSDKKNSGVSRDPFHGYPTKVKKSIILYGLLYFPFMALFLGFFLYRAGLIVTGFETKVLGKLWRIVKPQHLPPATRIRLINNLIRNSSILIGATMLVLTGSHKLIRLGRKTCKFSR